MYPLDSDTEAAIAAGRVRSADLVDFYLRDGVGDPLTLRCWNWPDNATYPGTLDLDGTTDPQTYVSMYGRIQIAKGIRLAATLAAEPLDIILDGSRSGDDEDWVGQFVDADWHQCRVRVRSVLIDRATGLLNSLPHWEWRGRLDHRNLTSQDGQPQTWKITAEGGLFRIRGRRLRTRSDEDQQRRSAGDKFYNGTAKMVGLPLYWAKAPANIPALQTVGGSSSSAPVNPITGRPLFGKSQ